MGQGAALTIDVDGLPPAKNEALSMLGARHGHAPRVLGLLVAARDAIAACGWVTQHGPVGLELTVYAAPGADPWDATNYLGGVADVLQAKERLHPSLDVSHLGDLRSVAAYADDRQIKDIRYTEQPSASPRYRIRIWPLDPSVSAV